MGGCAETKALKEGSLIGHKVIRLIGREVKYLFSFLKAIGKYRSETTEGGREERKYLDPRRSLGDGLLI